MAPVAQPPEAGLPPGAGEALAAGAARSPLPLALRLDQIGKVLMTTGHLMLWFSRLDEAQGWSAKITPAVFSMLSMSAVVIVCIWPRRYWRNRAWLAPVLRLMVMLGPSVRATGMGTALVLERPPYPGLVGLFRDIMRLLIGTRVLVLFIGAIVILLPPTQALLTQVLVTALTWNHRGYCGTAMLSHGVWHTRLSRAAAVLEVCSLPLSATMPVPTGIVPTTMLISGTAPAEPVCLATLAFVHAWLGAVLPTLISVWTWQPPAAEAAAQAPAAEAAQQEGEQPQQEADEQPGAEAAAAAAAAAACAPRQRRFSRLGEQALRVKAATDRRIHAALASHPYWAAWFTTALCWYACKSAAGLA